MSPSSSSPSVCADKLKVLADASRLSIVRILMSGPQHVGEINKDLQIDQSLLSHHLRVLREADLVRSQREGKAVLYRLSPDVHASTEKHCIQLGCCSLSFA